jgi:hypothetical protein
MEKQSICLNANKFVCSPNDNDNYTEIKGTMPYFEKMKKIDSWFWHKTGILRMNLIHGSNEIY